MTLSRGRVIPASELGDPVPVATGRRGGLPRGRVAPRDVVDAADRAREIVAEAEERASTLLADAQREAAQVRLRAEEEGRAEAAAEVAARALALADHEARADERQLDRAVELARILAERLLGEQLQLDPGRVVALAREALAEARGARRVTIVAHPEDVEALERSLSALGLDPGSSRIQADTTRARGNLRLETDIGVLDAELAPQLERLALKLRQSLDRG